MASLKKIARNLGKSAGKVANVVKDVALLPVTVPVTAGKMIGINSKSADTMVSKLDSSFSTPQNLLEGKSIKQNIKDTTELYKSAGKAGVPMPSFDIPKFDIPNFDFLKNLSQGSGVTTTGYSSNQSGYDTGKQSSNLPMIAVIAGVGAIGLLLILKRK